jgi:gliding motility-associated-like protein
MSFTKNNILKTEIQIQDLEKQFLGWKLPQKSITLDAVNKQLKVGKRVILMILMSLGGLQSVNSAPELTETSFAKIDYDSLEVTVTGKLALCTHAERGNISLEIKGGVAPYSIIWNNQATTTKLENLLAGSYTALITDALGTKHTEHILIQPPFGLILNPVEIENATCGAENGGAKISVKYGRGEPYQITWSHGLEGEWEPKNLKPGIYTVTVSDSYNCDVSVSFEVKSSDIAINVQETVQNPTCFGENDGQIKLDISGGAPPYQIRWSNGVSSQNLTGLSPGIYKVTIQDQRGCSFEKSIEVSAPVPLRMTVQTIFEQNCLTGIFEGIAKLDIIGGKPPFQIAWNTGQKNVTEIRFLKSSTVRILVRDAAGCVSEISSNLSFPNDQKSSQKLDFTFSKANVASDSRIQAGDEILFEFNEFSDQFIDWRWDFGDGNSSKKQNPIHQYNKLGEYEVSLFAVDFGGCATIAKHSLKVFQIPDPILIPNAFSPNGDGLNDIFFPVLRGVDWFWMEIFNTWGERIFSTKEGEIGAGWDGTYRGQSVPVGNYLYKISFRSDNGFFETRTGGITLIR